MPAPSKYPFAEAITYGARAIGAARSGDRTRLVALLDDDVVLHGDGGLTGHAGQHVEVLAIEPLARIEGVDLAEVCITSGIGLTVEHAPGGVEHRAHDHVERALVGWRREPLLPIPLGEIESQVRQRTVDHQSPLHRVESHGDAHRVRRSCSGVQRTCRDDGEPSSRIRFVDVLGSGCGELLDRVGHHRIEQHVTIGEVVVEGAVRHAGFGRNLGDGEPIALFGDHLHRRLDEQLAGARLLLVPPRERRLRLDRLRHD